MLEAKPLPLELGCAFHCHEDAVRVAALGDSSRRAGARKPVFTIMTDSESHLSIGRVSC